MYRCILVAAVHGGSCAPCGAVQHAVATHPRDDSSHGTHLAQRAEHAGDELATYHRQSVTWMDVIVRASQSGGVDKL